MNSDRDSVGIYISTDTIEAKAILEHNGKPNLMNSQRKEKERIFFNGYIFDVENLSIEFGERIREIYGLEFNPMALISNVPFDATDGLIKKLVGKGLFVATVSEKEVKSFFPDVYWYLR